jgi:serine/threonine protein kinase
MYLKDEVVQLAKSNGPNVVRMLGVSYDNENNILLVMEYIQYTLAEVVISAKYTNGHIWKWGQSLCQTMEMLHSKNIIHRDLKPQNILISDFPDTDHSGHGAGVLGRRNSHSHLRSDIKLCDFGFARHCHRGQQSDMSVLGTIIYMPPEVMEKNESYTKYDGRKYDVYSTSMILYYMWARREPFFHLSDIYSTTYGIMRAIIEQQERPFLQILQDPPNRSFEKTLPTTCSLESTSLHNQRIDVSSSSSSSSSPKQKSKHNKPPLLCRKGTGEKVNDPCQSSKNDLVSQQNHAAITANRRSISRPLKPLLTEI